MSKHHQRTVRSWSGEGVFMLLLALVGGIALVRDTLENGQDFAVFWKAAQYLLKGEPIYSLARDGGMTFKYPPWSVWLFVPFAALSLKSALLVFGLLEVFSLALILRWLVQKAGCQPRVVAISALLYWGLWAVHALDGQIVLPMLAAALWLWHPKLFLTSSWQRLGVLWGVLSLKIFTLFPLIALFAASLKASTQAGKKTTYRVFGVSLLASLLAALLLLLLLQASGQRDPWHLLLAWKESAVSGGQFLDEGQVRGTRNPGLTNFFIHFASALTSAFSPAAFSPASLPGIDVGVALLLSVMMGFAWQASARHWSPVLAWSSWLALVPVIHPLPWWHLFIFSFPLATLSLQQLVRMREQQFGASFCFLMGVLGITVVTEKMLGGLGLVLERACVKSWGVLLCLLGWRLLRSPTLRVKAEEEGSADGR